MLTLPVPRRLAALLLTWLTLVLVACTGPASSATPLPPGAEPPSDCARVDADGAIGISAQDLKFSAPCLVAYAGEAFTIHFENREAQVHNVAIYEDDSKTNEVLRGDMITGPSAEIDYAVPAMQAGQAYFDCTVHPAMNGTLYVVEREG